MAISGGQRLRQQLRAITTLVQREVREAVKLSALEVDRVMKRRIQKGPKTGRLYRRSSIKRRSTKGLRALGLRRAPGSPKLVVGYTYHRASAPGESPATDTGRLVSSIAIRYDAANIRATVGVHDEVGVRYARFLEFGTRRMRPRPFVRPTFQETKADIDKNITEAVARGIAKGAA